MCGIAGLFHPQLPKPVIRARIEAMIAPMTHRGPDGEGVWTAPGIGLGHKRLSIIDLSRAASQPMLSSDGRLALSFNGEIYNFRELREVLAERGHHFRTDSDTEVILAAWREWGPDCLSRFQGMFAFALYDEEADLLFLARDRLGVKPLFYTLLSDGALAFASELKGLMGHPLFRRVPRITAVEDFLALGYVPDDTSFLEGVSKLPAGHFLLVVRGKPVPQPSAWWDLDFRPRISGRRRDLEGQMVDHLRAAVRSRMIADVPLGAFLSGGVDSSAVVAFMAEASRQAVETCSIGFAQADHDESAHASLVAESFATRHRCRVVDSGDFSLIDQLIAAFDEPFADASALSTLQVSALARERVKVALSGDGADEVMAGYRRYRFFMAEERARRFLPRSVLKGVGALGDVFPKLDWAPRIFRAKTTLQALGQESAWAYACAVSTTSHAVRSSLYTSAFRSDLQGHRAERRYVEAFEAAPADDPLSRAQYADCKIWLPGDILTKVDRTSMAVSLEAREPLLDHRFVEFAAGLPRSLRLRRGQGKWLMKRALRGRLPDPILDRPKMGFVTPVSEWLRGPLSGEARAIARGSALAETGWFDPIVISRLADDHISGRSDHGRLLWQLVILERSLEHLFGLGSAEAAPSARRRRAG